MTSTQARTQKSRGAQATAAKRATMEMFQSKKPHEAEKTIKLNGETVTILMRAIGKREYDGLLTECPVSTKQRAEGQTYDQDKFAPKLLARVMVEPAGSEADWRNIWNSEEWNRSELGDLFYSCVDVCSAGVNPDPTEPDSE